MAKYIHPRNALRITSNFDKSLRVCVDEHLGNLHRDLAYVVPIDIDKPLGILENVSYNFPDAPDRL
jgi:hypothetical protein